MTITTNILWLFPIVCAFLGVWGHLIPSAHLCVIRLRRRSIIGPTDGTRRQPWPRTN